MPRPCSLGGFNKHSLIKLLSTHEDWDQEALAITFPISVDRAIDIYQVRRCKDALVSLAYNSELPEASKDAVAYAAQELSYSPSKYLECSASIEELHRITGMDCKCGQRTSRVLNAICKKYGLDKVEGYNACFAKLADSLNPLSISRNGYLSVHPCDYLEMSNADNPWHSCHNLDHGEYRAGTLSYMGDGSTMVFFTTSADDFGEHTYSLPKLTRQVFAYGNGILLQSRLYPDYEDADTATTYRNLVQRALAACLGAPDLWVRRTGMDYIAEYVYTDEDALHYTDYTYDCYHPSVSFLQDLEDPEPLTVGSAAHCLCCGYQISDSEEVLCYSCSDKGIVCEDCGARLDEDYAYYVGGHAYCRECVYICDNCGAVMREDNYYATDSRGQQLCLCEDCISAHTHYCNTCGEYFYNDCIYEQDGEYFCKDCLPSDEEVAS